jgi:hypothetical protein
VANEIWIECYCPNDDLMLAARKTEESVIVTLPETYDKACMKDIDIYNYWPHTGLQRGLKGENYRPHTALLRGLKVAHTALQRGLKVATYSITKRTKGGKLLYYEGGGGGGIKA